MKVLVTGAAGFVGKNLVASLKNIRDGKDRTRPELSVDEIYEYDIQTDPVLLEEYCAKTDFVFNLAGVNRPKDNAEFMAGNFGFCHNPAGNPEEAWEYLSGDAFFIDSGYASGPLCRL